MQRLALALVAGLVVIAVALALGLYAVADGIRDRGASDQIAVTGSAKRTITSDYVVWNATLASQAESPARAATQLSGWLEQTVKELEGSGIRHSELTVSPISTETMSKRGRITSYRLVRSLEVRSLRIDVVVKAIEDSSALLSAGVPLSAGRPQYVYTKLAELRPALSAEATKDAIERAQAIVEITGDKLGGVRDAYSSPFQVTAPGSTDVSDYGIYDTSTREKEVTAVINITFAVK